MNCNIKQIFVKNIQYFLVYFEKFELGLSTDGSVFNEIPKKLIAVCLPKITNEAVLWIQSKSNQY